MDVHLVMFQVLDKVTYDNGGPIPLELRENGPWKGTVQVPSNREIRVIMIFEDYVGKFAHHCHLLEDHISRSHCQSGAVVQHSP